MWFAFIFYSKISVLGTPSRYQWNYSQDFNDLWLTSFDFIIIIYYDKLTFTKITLSCFFFRKYLLSMLSVILIEFINLIA